MTGTEPIDFDAALDAPTPRGEPLQGRVDQSATPDAGAADIATVQIDPLFGASGPRPRRTTRVEQLQQQCDTLLSRLRLAIVYGHPGDKLEAESRAQAEALAARLARLGAHDVLVLPDDARLAERLARAQAGMAWLCAARAPGRAPCLHAASTMELLGAPYVGLGPLAISTLDCRRATKQALIGAGLPTPRFAVWRSGGPNFDPDTHEGFKAAFADEVGPFEVKPASGGAAGAHLTVEDRRDLVDAVDAAHRACWRDIMIEAQIRRRRWRLRAAGRVRASDGKLERVTAPWIHEGVRLDSPAPPRSLNEATPTTQSLTVETPLEFDLSLERAAEASDLAARAAEELVVDGPVAIELGETEAGGFEILDIAPDAGGASTLDRRGQDDVALAVFADRVDLTMSRRDAAARKLLEALSR